MKPLFVTAYTPRYADEARQCVESATAVDVQVEAVAIADLGSWVRNCGQKPAVILQAMQAHPGMPIVWIDADARLRRRPSLFEDIPEEIDLACHFRHGVELLSGTVYVGATSGALRLVDEWLHRCRALPEEWDQRVLAEVVKDLQPNVLRLPSEYTRVFDDPKMGDPVVEHLQASRRLA